MDLRKINSITKYPSILTYHSLGEKGRLTESLSEDKTFNKEESLCVYEKVDGENSRIILLKTNDSADYLIGSREELLYAKGDRIGNPYGNIASFLKPVADTLEWKFRSNKNIALTVIYQESYGGKSKQSKNYTNDNTQGYRVFDVFSLTHDELDELMDLPQEAIAKWRDRGNQPFYNEQRKQEFIKDYGLLAAPLLDELPGLNFPRDLNDTYDYLKIFSETKVGINHNGKSEGIIVRNEDRSMIRKIRFEDYERTLRNK